MKLAHFQSHTTPPWYQCLYKIFSKCNHLFGKYLGETHFVHKSRAVTRLKNFIEICQFILRILSKNDFGHESRAATMLFLNEIILLTIPYHSSPIPMSVQCICRILLKFVYSFLRYWPKMHFGHKSRAITLLFLNEIIPLAIPYQSSPIPMSMQSLKKIGKKVLKLEHGNKAQSIFDIHQGP